jgi:hypothetical protein
MRASISSLQTATFCARSSNAADLSIVLPQFAVDDVDLPLKLVVRFGKRLNGAYYSPDSVLLRLYSRKRQIHCFFNAVLAIANSLKLILYFLGIHEPSAWLLLLPLS